MKLATYKDGSRDGQLVVVSRDLRLAHFATGIAGRMQPLLDDWNFISPQLEDLYATLNGGRARHAFSFDPRLCMAPLPRAHEWVACVFPHDNAAAAPAVYPGSGGAFAGARDRWALPGADGALASLPGVAVVTGDLAAGSPPEQALEAVRLLMLAHDGWLVGGAGGDDGSAWAGVQRRLGTAFGPVAVTPDELDGAWQGGRVPLTLHWRRGLHEGTTIDLGAAMGRHFGELAAMLAAVRPLRAGCVLAGLVGPPNDPAARTLRVGDTLRIDLAGPDGHSVFGAIEQLLAHGDGESA
jgi:fumarylacetoacetate (FAA) hydrolase